jgi:hypothetical protein
MDGVCVSSELFETAVLGVEDGTIALFSVPETPVTSPILMPSLLLV